MEGAKTQANCERTAATRKTQVSKNWSRSAPKIKALAFFSRHLQTSRTRETLTRFMERMKTQYRLDKLDLNSSMEDMASRMHTRRPRSPPAVPNPIPNPDGPSWKPYEISPDKSCSLCDEVISGSPLSDVAMCRVCSDVFHTRCVLGCSDLHPSDVVNIGKASSNVGWSCPACANISLLLDADEVKEMSDKFGICDFDQDAKVTLHEYLSYQDRQAQKTDGKRLSDHEKLRVTNEFRLMDQNGDGILDWWEFVNYESKMYLARRKRRDLVDMLTEKELVAAKATFTVLDIDGDGRIKDYEALQAYKDWYRQFENQRSSGDVTSDAKAAADTGTMDAHAEQATRFIMNADTRGRGEIQWEDFILEQSLYIICSRPNYKVT